MGTPEFAVPALEQLVLNRHEVVAVYTQPDKPAGRGRGMVASPVKKMAEGLNLPVLLPVSFKDTGTVTRLAEFEPDAIVVAAFGKLLPQSVLDIPRYGCINVHPSLLPRHRGAAPVAAAILAGDVFTGVSIMLLDRGMDTGPVLVQAQVPISDYDTTGSLTAKLSLVGARMLPEVLIYLSRGEIAPRPQPVSGATYSKLLTKEEGEIDWHLSAVEIGRRVRAFQPWPGAFTRWREKRLQIIGALAIHGVKDGEPGRVVTTSVPGAGFGVGTGDGVLGVTRVQLEGKQAMPATDFARGQRELFGARLQ